jgi:hypothetical protein
LGAHAEAWHALTLRCRRRCGGRGLVSRALVARVGVRRSTELSLHMTALGQNEPRYSLRLHGRSTSVSGPTGPAVRFPGRATSGPIKSRCHRNIAATSVMMQASPSRIWTPTTARKTGEVEGIANPLCWSSTAAPPPQARPRPTSRISNTGQSGAALPEHRATVLANRRSSFFRSLSLALMSSR